MPTVSLIEKYGWNRILSMFLLSPIGLLYPVLCKNNKWIITIAAIMNGNRKWGGSACQPGTFPSFRTFGDHLPTGILRF